MPVLEIKIPAMGESITEGTVANWLKKPGEFVNRDEAIAEIETDKVTQEIYAPEFGTIREILRNTGESARVGEVIAMFDVSPAAAPAAPIPEPAKPPTEPVLSPAASKIAAEQKTDTAAIQGSGKNGRITKADVLSTVPGGEKPQEKTVAESRPVLPAGERETIVPMTRLRKAIAERLVSAQQSAAILTTFNEADMKGVMDLREKYKDVFLKKYGVKPGFMSFFVKAVVHALKEVPEINAEIRGDSIVYKKYYDIGVAVGGPKGLVVPIVRNADQLSFAEIEMEITRLAGKVRDASISLAEMQGGTFTISNGGIYGSMLSTPILNPPQSGILGMHNITDRPVVVDGQIVIRPVMYLALSYDHRIVDGKEAVTFLVKVKNAIEDPARLLLEV